MSRTPEDASPRVALVLDAGGARSAYQVCALEVLLPALAERSARPRLLIGTSAGALLSGVLAATALSVQLVVLRGDPEIRANNRALALNAACEGCGTASAALQLVVEGGHTYLSPWARRELERWVEEQAAVLRQQARSAQFSGRVAQDRTGAALRELDDLVSEVLSTETLRGRAQFRTLDGVKGPQRDRTRGFVGRAP